MTLRRRLTGPGTENWIRRSNSTIRFQGTHKGGENHGHKNYAKAVKADQRPCQKTLLQLCRRQLSSAGRWRRTRLCAVHQPVWNLLQLFQKCSPSRRQGTVRRDHAAKSSKEMPNLQVILRTKGKEPALLPGLRRRPKAEESRRAPAQETVGTSPIRFQDGVLTRDTVLRRQEYKQSARSVRAEI